MSTQLEKNIIHGILLCIQILNPIPKALGTTLSSKKALIFWRTALKMLVANFQTYLPDPSHFKITKIQWAKIA